jgi:hypothetical protein
MIPGVNVFCGIAFYLTPRDEVNRKKQDEDYNNQQRPFLPHKLSPHILRIRSSKKLTHTGCYLGMPVNN